MSIVEVSITRQISYKLLCRYRPGNNSSSKAVNIHEIVQQTSIALLINSDVLIW